MSDEERKLIKMQTDDMRDLQTDDIKDQTYYNWVLSELYIRIEKSNIYFKTCRYFSNNQAKRNPENIG